MQRFYWVFDMIDSDEWSMLWCVQQLSRLGAAAVPLPAIHLVVSFLYLLFPGLADGS
jgi:hypothetical protein